MSVRDDRGFEPADIEIELDAANSSAADEPLDPPHQFGSWRARRNEYLGAAVILVVAVVVAYLLGAHQSRSDGSGSTKSDGRSSAASGSRPAITGTIGPAIAQGDGLCATQLGAQLQLGAEIVNKSTGAVTLTGLDAVLPLGGLRASKTVVGTCGQLLLTRAVAGTVLAAGASTWISVTFDVLVSCPKPLPVQFNVQYAQSSAASSVTLGGFADLGSVTYSGCQADQ